LWDVAEACKRFKAMLWPGEGNLPLPTYRPDRNCRRQPGFFSGFFAENVPTKPELFKCKIWFFTAS
jgi:hypothetical protein